MKKFNTALTLAAFLANEEKKSPLSLYAHRIMLQSDYTTKYARPLRKMVNKAIATKTETLYSGLIGMFALQLPRVNIVGDWHEHQIVSLYLHMSQILINVLDDSKELEVVSVDTVVSPETNNGKSARRKLVIAFSGNKVVKDMTRGIKFSPGYFDQKSVRGGAITTKFKDFARNAASMSYTASDVMSLDMLIHGYKLSKDYNSENINGEPRCDKKARILSYASVIMDLVQQNTELFFPIKYDNRSRMYTLFNFIGMRPQGKLWETLMIDAYKPRVQGKSAIKHLKHIIYCTRYSKTTVAIAEANFTDEDLQWAIDQDPMAITKTMKSAEKKFGEAILVNKASTALLRCIAGEPCNYLFGKDLTNSGLMSAGSSFKAEKILNSVNLGGEDTVNDAYTLMHKTFNLSYLSRDEFKDMIMPLFNGASINGLIRSIADTMRKNTGIELVSNVKQCPVVQAHNDAAVISNTALEAEIALITKQSIKDKLIEALGLEVLNIMSITTWAAKAVNSYQSTLYFTTMDGFPACSYAHILRCPVALEGATTATKSGHRPIALVANLPYHCQADGSSIYDKDFIPEGAGKPVQVKNSGGFANSSHAIDPVLARRVSSYAYANGDVCLLKHDDYIMFPDNFDAVIEIAQDFFQEVSEVNPHKKAMIEMHSRGINMPPMPMLHIGEATVKKSINFLMP